MILIEVPPETSFPLASQYNTSPLHEASFINNSISTPAKSNPEYTEPVLSVIGGRKRNIVNRKKQKQLEKNKISADWIFIDCGHVEKSKNSLCKVYNLSLDDMNIFRKNISIINNKIEQDKFILTMITINSAKDTRRHTTPRALRTYV